MADGETWIRAAACGDLADGEALAVPAPDGRTIALFFTDGAYHATDNQCPHMGFPLVRGLVRNGMVTCDWHGRSFDLTGGGCFHSQCDDVRVFPTEVRDDAVWVRTGAHPEDRREARLRLLWEGLLGDDRWTMSKAIAQLLHGGVPEAHIVELHSSAATWAGTLASPTTSTPATTCRASSTDSRWASATRAKTA